MLRTGIMAACITFLLAVAQTMLGGHLALGGVSPDFLLVWAVCVGLRGGPQAGAIIGFASGVLQGSLAQGWIGAHGCGKTLSGALAGVLSHKLERENWLTPVVCASALTLVNELCVLLFGRLGLPHHFLRFLGLRMLYHAVLAWPTYALARWAWRVRPRALVS